MITVELRSPGLVLKHRIFPPPEPQFPKRCRCGRTYHHAAWSALERLEDHVDDVLCLELRHCLCGSTIGVIREVYDPTALEEEEE